MARILVLNSVAPLGADSILNSGNLNLTALDNGVSRTSIIPVNQILKNYRNIPYAAGTAGVWTITPTTGATTYSLNIKCNSKLFGEPKTFTYTVNNASALTATQINDAFRAAIAADTSIPVTGSGGATLILTMSLTYGVDMIVTNNAPASTMGIVHTTPGVLPTGLGSVITANGNFSSSDIVATNQYTTIELSFYNISSRDAVDTEERITDIVLYVNEGDSDALSLTGLYGTLTQGVKGVIATWVASTGNPAVANGVITLTTDVFYGNTDTNIGSQWLAAGGQGNAQAGDVIYVATAPYVITSVLTGATANTANIPNDATAAAGWYVQLRNGN